MFRARKRSLDPWLGRLKAEWTGGCRFGAELRDRLRASGFAGSLRVVGEWAKHAGTAAITVPCSSGHAEGNVNRLKLTESQLPGRANLYPFKARLMAAE